jgi:hypothetical protein
VVKRTFDRLLAASREDHGDDATTRAIRITSAPRRHAHRLPAGDALSESKHDRRPADVRACSGGCCPVIGAKSTSRESAWAVAQALFAFEGARERVRAIRTSEAGNSYGTDACSAASCDDARYHRHSTVQR